MLRGYENIIETIQLFKLKKISFEEFSSRILSISGDLGRELDYRGDLQNVIDNWIEYILYSYSEESQHELGCSLGDFIESAITKEPRPLTLPLEDRVVREQFRRLT